jgi:hypothetical protein
MISCLRPVLSTLGLSGLRVYGTIPSTFFIIVRGGRLLLLFNNFFNLLSGFLGLLSFELFRVSVEEQVHGHVPVFLSVDGASHSEHFSSQEPVHKTNGESSLVVARDGNIDKLEGRVGVAESDDRDAHIRGLLDSLRVDSRIGDDQNSGFSVLSGDLVGEGTGGESSSEGLGSDVVGELKHSSLAVRSGRDGADIFGVLNGDQETSSKHKLLPGLLEVQEVHVVGSTLGPDILVHSDFGVFGANVHFGGEQLDHVVVAGSEDLRNIHDGKGFVKKNKGFVTTEK